MRERWFLEDVMGRPGPCDSISPRGLSCTRPARHFGVHHNRDTQWSDLPQRRRKRPHDKRRGSGPSGAKRRAAKRRRAEKLARRG